MTTCFGKRSHLRMHFLRTVLRQHYVDGYRVFKPEAIGRPHDGAVVVTSRQVGLDNLELWNGDTYRYELLGFEPVPESELRNGTWIFDRRGSGYALERTERWCAAH